MGPVRSYVALRTRRSRRNSRDGADAKIDMIEAVYGDRVKLLAGVSRLRLSPASRRRAPKCMRAVSAASTGAYHHDDGLRSSRQKTGSGSTRSCSQRNTLTLIGQLLFAAW